MKEIRTLKSLSGQATVEYMLIMVVVILVFMGALWQFNGAFQKYASIYFGEYLTCLLETGELPSLGSQSAGGVICQSPIFNPSDGQAFADSTGLAGNGGGGSSGSKGEGGAGTEPDGKGNAAKSGDGEDSDGGDDSGAGESVGGGGRGSTSAGFLKSPFTPRQAVTPVGQVGGESGIESVGVGGLGTSARPATFVGETRKRITQLEGGYEYSGNFDRETGRKRESPVAKVEGGNATLRQRKVAVDQTRKTASAANEEEEEYSLGGLFRILLIAAIIIAMLIFFGGQALQVSKSWEKS